MLMCVKFVCGVLCLLCGILLCDQNFQVVMVVLLGSVVFELEIEQVFLNCYIVEEVLMVVVNCCEWVQKYVIMYNLV